MGVAALRRKIRETASDIKREEERKLGSALLRRVAHVTRETRSRGRCCGGESSGACVGRDRERRARMREKEATARDEGEDGGARRWWLADDRGLAAMVEAEAGDLRLPMKGKKGNKRVEGKKKEGILGNNDGNWH